MNSRALAAATGVILLASAAITAFNGMWAVEGMDGFADEWQHRLQSAPAAPSRDELFESLNGFVGHRLSRMIVWSLAVQGIAGLGLLVGSLRARPAAVPSPAAEDQE